MKVGGSCPNCLAIGIDTCIAINGLTLKIPTIDTPLSSIFFVSRLNLFTLRILIKYDSKLFKKSYYEQIYIKFF